MNRGPRPGTARAVPFVANARAAWGDAVPDEILVLAEECERTTATATAKTIGYSPAVVSHLLANRYPGDVRAVFIRIRGALMRETVDCPVIGEIRKDQCLTHQKKPFAATNAARTRLFHACPTCPNRHRNQGDAS